MALRLRRQTSKKTESNLVGSSVTYINNDVVVADLRKKLQVFHRINQLYNETSFNFTKLMTTLLNLIVETLEAQGGSLWIYSKDKEELECKVATGPGSREVTNVKVRTGQGVVGWVAENKKSTLVNDTDKDKRFDVQFNTDGSFSTQSLLACPLLCGDELIGVLEVVNRQKAGADHFNQVDLSFLENICIPMAMFLKSSQSLQSQNNTIERFNLLKKLQEDFATTIDLEKLLSIVLNKALNLLDAEVGSIWLVVDNGEGAECYVAEGPTKDKVKGIKVRTGTGVIGWIIENKVPSIIEDCSKDPRFNSALDKKIDFVTNSMISAPLLVQGECIGAIQIINKRQAGVLFQPADLDFLMMFASNAGMYIKNAKLFAAEKKAKELSALIRVSKEITSTLDIDAVLMSVVNLGSDVVPYDQASVSTRPIGSEKFAVRAITAKETIDQDEPQVIELNALHNLISKASKEIFVNSFEEAQKNSEMPKEVIAFMQSHKLQSFWSYVMKDDQGELGVLIMSSDKKNMVTESTKELLSILISQSTVALRNAELYTTIPNEKLMSRLKDKLIESVTQIRNWPRARVLKFSGAICAVVLALVFIRVPYEVASAIEVVPLTATYYSQSQGVVKEILVKEGEVVKAGQTLARLNVDDLEIQKSEKESSFVRLKAEMTKLAIEDDVANYKIKESEWFSVQHELTRLKKQIQAAIIVSESPGIVIAEKLQDLLGQPVNFGTEIIKIARSDLTAVEFRVQEEDVIYVRAGQKLKFKVFGFPNHSFSTDLLLDSVAGEGRQITPADPQKYFIARAFVPNTSDVQLRPGMTGRGKIHGEPCSLAYMLFAKPLRFFMNEILF